MRRIIRRTVVRGLPAAAVLAAVGYAGAGLLADVAAVMAPPPADRPVEAGAGARVALAAVRWRFAAGLAGWGLAVFVLFEAVAAVFGKPAADPPPPAPAADPASRTSS